MRLNWTNLLTIGSATILIGVIVFGLAFATGWALGGLFGLGAVGSYIFEAILVLFSLLAMYAFVRSAVQVEPILERDK